MRRQCLWKGLALATHFGGCAFIHVMDFCCYFIASLTDVSLMMLQCSAIENVPCVSVYSVRVVFIGTGFIKMFFAISLGEKKPSHQE